MTVLNTFANLGSMWVTPIAFQLVDLLTFKEPVLVGADHYIVDGFYVVSVFCALLGLTFFGVLNKKANEIMDYKKVEWRIGRK